MAFLLSPAYKDYLWGGRKLADHYNKQGAPAVLAESWELSAHPDGDCQIATGPWAGQPFSRYVRERREELGLAMEGRGEFPLLIKLIDAQKSLSIQVHPDDDYAARVEGGQGKTEMWYILDCEPGAFLYRGFSSPQTGEEVRRRIREGTLEEVLQKEYIKPGEAYFIPAGVIHAIGQGIVLAEVQQSSNATYRVYDYGRLDQDGNPRELHLDKALDVLCYEAAERPQPAPLSEGAAVRPLAACPYFTVEGVEVSGRWESAQSPRSFLSLLCVQGSGMFCCGEEQIPLKKGDSLFVPAGERPFQIEGTLKLIQSSL